MKVAFEGTASARGWPEPGCGCASCGRAANGGRRPLRVVLDDVVRLPLTGNPPPGYRAARTLHGLELTAPDGHRLLHADVALAGAAPPGGPCDVLLVDLLDAPQRLGALRRAGVVADRTRVVAVNVDHRVSSEEELARRLRWWGVLPVPDGTVLDTALPAPPPPPVPRRTLVLGGSRSGKSAQAELALAAEPHVTYVATGPSGGDDPEWLARVRAHRARRPAHWSTEETTDLPELLRTAHEPLLVDGIGTWLAAVFDECGAWPGSGTAVDAVEKRCDELVAAWRRTRTRVVAVSDEVGLGVIPATPSGRLFRDVLGALNQRLSAESEQTLLVVAGRVLPLPY